MKLKTAITYRLRYQLASGSIFFGYMLLFSILFPVISMVIASTHTQVDSDVLAPPCVFLVILAFIGITSDFKLFIQNSMSRSTIFLTCLISNFLLTLCVTCGILLVKLVVNLFDTNFKITLFLIHLYAKNNDMETIILLFIFLLVSCSLGTLIGICRDSLSSIIQLILLGILTLLPTFLILLLKIASPEALAKLFDFLKRIVGITDMEFHLLPLVTLLLVVYFVFTTITYLLNRRREIMRING